MDRRRRIRSNYGCPRAHLYRSRDKEDRIDEVQCMSGDQGRPRAHMRRSQHLVDGMDRDRRVGGDRETCRARMCPRREVEMDVDHRWHSRSRLDFSRARKCLSLQSEDGAWRTHGFWRRYEASRRSPFSLDCRSHCAGVCDSVRDLYLDLERDYDASHDSSPLRFPQTSCRSPSPGWRRHGPSRSRGV